MKQTKEQILAKLNSVAKPATTWLEQAQYREDNYEDIKKAQKIALIVLRTLRARKMSQKELAEKIGATPQLVNKWLKGKENFTLSTVEKLENALNIKLMQIVDVKPAFTVIKASQQTFPATIYNRTVSKGGPFSMRATKSKKQAVSIGFTRPVISKSELLQA